MHSRGRETCRYQYGRRTCQLEEQQADGIQIGLRGRPAGDELLRRLARRRACDLAAAIVVYETGESEIGDADLTPAIEHHVRLATLAALHVLILILSDRRSSRRWSVMSPSLLGCDSFFDFETPSVSQPDAPSALFCG